MKKRNIFLALYLLPFLWFLSLEGCYYDNEQDLYPSGICNTDSVRYNLDVAPVIDLNCNTCHNAAAAQGDVVLEGYASVKDIIDNGNGRFIGSLKHSAGFVPMPQGGNKLDDCTILKIEKWISNGAPNN